MEMQKINPTLKMSFNSSTIFGVLLALIWCRYTVVTYVLQVISMLPIVGVVSSMVFPAVVILLILTILPWMIKQIRIEAIIFYLAATATILLSMVLFPENGDACVKRLPGILTTILPMVFIGVCYDHERHKGMLFWASLLGVVTMLGYQIYKLGQGEELLEDSMDAAYKTLPSIMFLIYTAFEKKKLRYSLLAVVAGIAIFVFGSRGPILCVFAFLAISLLLVIGKQKKTTSKVLIITIVGGVALLLVFGDILTTLAESFSEQFAKWGFSTRIFDYFIEGDIADSNGRDSFFGRTTAAILEKPILGYGFLGDQMLLGQGRDGSYAHNLFLEIWCQFGIIAGTVILVYFIAKPILALARQKGNTDMQSFLWMLICMNFVKLMLSSTYTVEQMFFFMIGVSMAMSSPKNSRPSAPEHIKE